MSLYQYCTAGRIRRYAISSSQWSNSVTQITAVQAKAGAYITSQDANMTCAQCPSGTYSEGGGVYECSVCGDNTYSSAGASSCTSCYTVNGYGNSGTLASNHAKESSCKLTCAAGTYVAASRAACIPVGQGYWRGEHTVSQGSTSTPYECPDTYDYGSATAGSPSECATRCDGGTYVDVAGGTCLSSEPGGKCTSVASGSGKCVSVDDGYYRTSHVVYYGQASEQKLCPENYRDGGPAAMLGDCVGRFLKTGTQVEGDIPENCTEVTEWNDCVPPTCYYEKNYNKVITKDCEPGTCTKRPNAVKADANYYDGDGTYCPACSTVGDVVLLVMERLHCQILVTKAATQDVIRTVLFLVHNKNAQQTLLVRMGRKHQQVENIILR